MKRKSLFQKITAAAAAFTMAAGLLAATAVTASANTTASQPDTGTITVHKYSRATQGTVNPDNIYSGEELAAGVTATLGTPLAGAGFSLYKLDMTTVTAALASGGSISQTYTVDMSNPAAPSVTFNLENVPGQTTITANLDTGFTTQTGTTDATGVFQFGNADLADGHYLLAETTTPTAHETCEPVVIRLPLTLNDGSGANRDVHVYPKDIRTDAAAISKTFEGGAAAVLNDQDSVPFKISAHFFNDLTGTDAVSSVNDLRDGTNYGAVTVTDPMQNYFEMDASSILVKFLDGAGTDTGVSLAEGTDYIYTTNTAAGSTDHTWELTPAGIDKAILAQASSMTVEFDTTYINAAFAAAGVSERVINNTAQVQVRKAGSSTAGDADTEDSGTSAVFPHVSVEVDKEDETGANMAGVTFALAKVAAPTLTYSSNDWAAYTSAQKATLLGEYVCDNTGKPITATTNASGKILFSNVPYDETAGVSYYLKELETVEGYQLKDVTQLVELQSKADLDGTSYVTDGEWVTGAHYVVAATIINYPVEVPDPESPAFSLPLTGGTGTAIFIALGVLIMGGAAALYCRSRKRA